VNRAPDCTNDTSYFQCRDKKFCIYKHLVCDGYTHCDDESDEDEDSCKICPHVNSVLRKSQTFSCRHRYTKRPICAAPCDGYDDLCHGYSDEDCKGISFWVIMVFVGCLIAMLSSMAILVEQLLGNFNEKGNINCQNINNILLLNNVEETLSLDTYRKIRKHKQFGTELCNLILHYKIRGQVNKAKPIMHQFYNMEIDHNLSQTECVDDFYFKVLGTNISSEYFYDVIENSLAIIVEFNIIRRYPKFILVGRSKKYFNMAILYIKCLTRILFHYADFVKDILLLIQIWKFMFGNSTNTLLRSMSEFPSVVFFIMLTSIAVTEMTFFASVINIIKVTSYSNSVKMLSIVITPFIPAVVNYMELKHEIEQLNMLSKLENVRNSHLIKTQKYICKWRSQRADLNAKENLTEHFPQLVLLLLIFILQKTNTAKVIQMNRIFLNSNELLIIFSTGWSFVSLIRGQLSYINATKNNFVPLLGKLVLLVFIAIGMLGRLLAIVLFCTPFMGLFDTNYHGTLGKIEVTNYPFKDGRTLYRTLFNYSKNNTAIVFGKAWEKYRINNIFKFSTSFCILFITLILLHVVIGYILQPKQTSQSKEKSVNDIFQEIYALLCPPMFLDWEVIHRGSGGLVTVPKSWRMSQKLLIYHIVMHLVEHVLLLIPLMLLKRAIAVRNELLTELFPPLNDELYSTYIVNVLIAVGLSVAFLLPPIQYGLAHLYFYKGHPWSRILKAKLQSKKRLDVEWSLRHMFRNELDSLSCWSLLTWVWKRQSQ
jgi:hypothetical protein